MGYKDIIKTLLAGILTIVLMLPDVHAQQSTNDGSERGSDSINSSTSINTETDEVIELPYGAQSLNRSVSAISIISGEELESYPGTNFMEALRGRIPGLVIWQGNTMPGFESTPATIRGTGAVVYIDGVRRDPSFLTAYEVDQVQVMKDISGRGLLGVSGANPVIWITTKKGNAGGDINVSLEYGLHEPTVLPDYLNAYDYATLFNEAMVNDGNEPEYSNADLEAFRSQSNPLINPDVNYYDTYVKNVSSFRRINVDFSNSLNELEYYAMVNYTGNSGLESVGQQIRNDRFRARGNVSFPVSDWIDLEINVLGTYQDQTFPNVGGGAFPYNMFSEVLSFYPSNAHPVTHDGQFIISDDYPENINNSLSLESGRGEMSRISSHNDGKITMDLGRYVEGLSFQGIISFDIDNYIGIGRGGTNPLYRVTSGGDLEIVQERVVDPNMSLGSNIQSTRTQGIAQLNYDLQLDDNHDLTLDGAFFRSYYDGGGSFQPEQLMDMSLRANYAYQQKYVLQLDVTHSGSMRLPEGQRFNTYPAIGAAWVASNENFIKDIDMLNYLKLYSSYGKTGINDFFVGYDPYYLYRTSWDTFGAWTSGVEGNRGSSPIAGIIQFGNENLSLPEREFFNVGLQGRAINDRVSFEINYYEEKNTGLLTSLQNVTPSVLGGGSFSSVQNYESNKKWGFDGMAGFSGNVGGLGYNIAVNALYTRGKYLQVDEAPSLADYRKLSGRDMDLFRMYQSDGLFQNQSDIDAHVPQSWGDVQPGDIRYTDFNDDGVINEQDVHAPGAHSPRLFYGVNFSLNFRGLNMFMQGTGVADGQVILGSGRYFRINNTQQNYSAPMLDRWPETNNYPRLTTSSANNVQNSTFWVRNANYFRLSHVELSYSLSQLFTESNSDKSWKVFLRGTNLVTLSGLKDYSVDPTSLNAGITSYPVMRTVTAGFTLNL